MLILIVPAFPDLHWHRRHGISRAPPAAPRVFTEKFIAALASRGWSHFEREAVSLMVLVPVVFSARVLSAANRRKVCRSASCALSYADQPWCGWRLASPSRERVDSRSESPKRIPPAELCRRLTPERSPVSYKRMNRVDGTKQRLLEAGRRLFADQGFDGASVRAITRRARANLGAVTYHFGSKQALYTAVLEQLFGELRERVTAATAAPAEARDGLGAIIRAFFAFFADHPEAPRLIIQRLAAGDYTASLFRLFGDANGDRFVNGADFALFRAAFGAGPLDPNYDPAFDANSDGFINGIDFEAFRARFGSSLP